MLHVFLVQALAFLLLALVLCTLLNCSAMSRAIDEMKMINALGLQVTPVPPLKNNSHKFSAKSKRHVDLKNELLASARLIEKRFSDDPEAAVKRFTRKHGTPNPLKLPLQILEEEQPAVAE